MASTALDEASSRLLRSEGVSVAPERLQGDVSLDGLPLGSVRIQTCPANEPGRFSVESRIVPAALLRALRRMGGRLHSLLSSAALTPLETQVDVYDGDKTRTYLLRYRPGGFDYEYRRSAEAEPKHGTRELPLPAPVNDMHSAMLLMRSWRPRLGEEAHFYVALGRNLWRVDARARGPEMLAFQGVPTLCRRIDGEARRISALEESDAAETERSFSLWFSDDRRTLPVRLVASAAYGDVAMALGQHDQEGCQPAAAER